MKLQDRIKTDLITFEAAGTTWYMKPLTIKQVTALQVEFKKMEENPDDISPLLVLFTDVLVGDDGEPFEEVKNGLTFEQLSDMLPITVLTELADKVTEVLSGKHTGN